MNFVITEYALAGGIQQNRAVGRQPLPFRISFPIHHADEEIIAGILRDAQGARGEGLLVEREGSGHFGPDDDAGDLMRGVHADVFELVQVTGMQLRPIGRITFGLREIGLHQMRDVARSGGGNQVRADHSDEDQHDGDDDGGAPRAARIHEHGVGEQRAVGGNRETQAVDSGDAW